MASGSTGQSGIDILCDAAAGSDLLSGLLPVRGNEQQQRQQQQQQQLQQHPQLKQEGRLPQQQGDPPQQYHHHHQALPRHTAPPSHPAAPTKTTPASKKAASKRKLSASSPATSATSHVCHICKRVYERADHLTRHLRSHENARPYQCTRCPKRFNRADLLTRHETTHNRDDAATVAHRAFVRRSDRAAEACINCSASKSKCEDQKPCTRCRNKGLDCQMPARRGTLYRTSDAENTLSPSESSPMASGQPGPPGGDMAMASAGKGDMLSGHQHIQPDGSVEQSFMQQTMAQPPMPGGFGHEMMFFNSSQNPFQDMDFSWDLNFDGITIPNFGVTEPSSQMSSSTNSQPSSASNSKQSSRTAARDHSRGHAAFKRSPWLWEPETGDYGARVKEGLALPDETVAPRPLALHSFPDIATGRLKISAATRDTLFAIVLSQHANFHRVPSFPTLGLLNHLIQAHFVQDVHKFDNWIHTASFDTGDVLPELLAAVIASGAMYISTPSIWRFGFALQEVVRVALGRRFDGSNSTTRDLETVQAFTLQLDIAQWSGFSRSMEITESFCQPILTMLRRSGKMAPSTESEAMAPNVADSAEMLDAKWNNFVRTESYKRLVIHLFFHDAQSSIGLTKPPIMSYNELCFSLPASRDLWNARGAEEWRDMYLAKGPAPTNPRVSEIMNRTDILDELGNHVDVDLCYMTLLHGFWGQIAAYRESAKLYSARSGNDRASAHRVWMAAQHQALYQDLCEFSLTFQTYRRYDPHILLLCELFMMILHVSPDELQRYAGKYGEDEAQNAAQDIEDNWANGPEARCAVWHAGQVLRHARKLAPTTLRGFNAIAVYLASLTLWAYGPVSCAKSDSGQEGIDYQHPTTDYVLIDGGENRETKAFVQQGLGVPALRVSADPNAGTASLSNPDTVLSIARAALRDNFPMRSESLPPIVESLERLLRDLGLNSGRGSRVASDEEGSQTGVDVS